MELLAKIFATGLALSQVVTSPDNVKTQFDRDRDHAEVQSLLVAGCTHMRKAFDVESIDLDDLINTAMDDPQSVAGDNRAFRGIKFDELVGAYRQFCKKDKAAGSSVDLKTVIDTYNVAAADLPDHNRLKNIKLPQTSVMLDRNGERFSEFSEDNERRVWVGLAQIPEHVKMAFIAAEDKRFFQHQGIDERALVRAFIGNLTSPGRPQGGSTISQQVVKKFLAGDDVTYERKIREIILVSRIEQTLSKPEILELYLNSIYFGRNAWGIQLASRSYFGKSATDLSVTEAAFLAGLVKGPNYFHPDRYPARVQGRLAYVLSRMHEEGVAEAKWEGRQPPPLPKLIAYEPVRRGSGAYVVDQVARDAKSAAGIAALTSNAYTVRSTLDPKLQQVVEQALQNGLAQYERAGGRARFDKAETNLAAAVDKIRANSRAADEAPPWRQALAQARLPLYDVQWTPAIVVQKPEGRNRGDWRVGLADGRVLPLALGNSAASQKLNLYDVVRVQLYEQGKREAARAELRTPPRVQGSIVVLENRTGRVLAMTGGFSYPLSQLNRATQSSRQPGSALKPLIYLAALGKGLQPNTLVRDDSITLPPPTRGGARDYWTPKNYEGREGGALTIRRALANSRNLATVRLLDGGIEEEPRNSLNRLCDLSVEVQLYRQCQRYYPFVLGAQPVRPIDLAAFYATIANEGKRPVPHVIESIELGGQTIYRHQQKLDPVRSVDAAAHYQLKTMMQGVLSEGTARSLASLAPYVAGKTGTSNEENDAWFVGFTNEVTVAVWIGYDNSAGGRRTLGRGATGGRFAVPIFSNVIEGVWAHISPRTRLAPPTLEASRSLSCNLALRDPENTRDRRSTSECLRVDARGRVIDTQYRLVSRPDTFEMPGDPLGAFADSSPGWVPFEGGRIWRRMDVDPRGIWLDRHRPF
jgi:penicillin-binding protein 1A